MLRFTDKEINMDVGRCADKVVEVITELKLPSSVIVPIEHLFLPMRTA